MPNVPDTLNGSPAVYDFSNDGANNAYKAVTDALEKYCWYKISHPKYRGALAYSNAAAFRDARDLSNIPDPDTGSKTLWSIYRALYGDKAANSADTMNSVQTTLNEYVVRVIEKENPNFREVRGKKRISFLYFLELVCNYRETISESLRKVGAINFMEACHTLGNFIPVPEGCNAPRGSCLLKDYWDLTLACIYNWYPNEDKITKTVGGKPLEYSIGMIFAEDEQLKRYAEWLNTFKTWKGFVEQNFMRPFVGAPGHGAYGRPRELWRGHFEGDVLPKEEWQFKEFFKNATRWVLNRGALMQEALERG